MRLWFSSLQGSFSGAGRSLLLWEEHGIPFLQPRSQSPFIRRGWSASATPRQVMMSRGHPGLRESISPPLCLQTFTTALGFPHHRLLRLTLGSPSSCPPPLPLLFVWKGQRQQQLPLLDVGPAIPAASLPFSHDLALPVPPRAEAQGHLYSSAELCHGTRGTERVRERVRGPRKHS